MYYSWLIYPVVAMVAAIGPYIRSEYTPFAETPVEEAYRIMFYNVENLFDVHDDSLTNDEDFTPEGDLHWNVKRYHSKLNNLSKVIIALGGWNPPDIIGLCEVENRNVLQDLFYKSLLSKFEYGIVHQDSPDRRGIDVALVYNRKTVKFLNASYLEFPIPGFYTRDILYATFILNGDTCHIFVNHWPSRTSGQLETEKSRFAAARMLRHCTDSLFRNNENANILIMGDFNDDPHDPSLAEILKAGNADDIISTGNLYNLTRIPERGMVKGTLKFQGYWNAFDQIIVSGNLLSGRGNLYADRDGYGILHNGFLLEPDEMYNGYKPYRTYAGFRYQGGFSDHLPVYIDLVSQ